jgi:GxxExxY protein
VLTGSRLVEPGERADVLARAVIGAAIEVHRELGPGFLESLYEEALCVELALRGIRFQRQLPVDAAYKGQNIGQARLDLLVESLLVVELKSVDALAPIHTAQVLSYLKLTRKPLALLINFNARILKDGIKRVALTR